MSGHSEGSWAQPRLLGLMVVRIHPLAAVSAAFRSEKQSKVRKKLYNHSNLWKNSNQTVKYGLPVTRFLLLIHLKSNLCDMQGQHDLSIIGFPSWAVLSKSNTYDFCHGRPTTSACAPRYWKPPVYFRNLGKYWNLLSVVRRRGKNVRQNSCVCIFSSSPHMKMSHGWC